MKIFITGISGMVGGTLANFFCSKGWEVQGLGRSAQLPAWVDSKCTYNMHDIRNPLNVIDADVVIHAAALASDTVNFQQAYATNVLGTRNVLNAVKNRPHLIYISSSSVYDFVKEITGEDSGGQNYQALSAYGQSKYLAEQEVLRHPGLSKITVLRPRAIYGKNDLVVLPRLLKLVKGHCLYLPANLSRKISLTHIDNLVMAVEACIIRQTQPTEIFNVADDHSYDLGDVLSILLPLAVGRPLKKVSIPAALVKLLVIINNNIQFYRPLNRFAVLSLTGTALLDIQKIKQEVEYLPVKDFYNSYPQIIHWIHNDEGWKWYFKEANGLNLI